jgi:hypothetical protein
MRYSLLLVLSVLVVGCSEQSSATQDPNAPIKIETNQMYVGVKNDAGLALNDVTVSIVPTGRSTVYSKFVGRIENAESRQVMLGEFYGRDGTPFSLRVVRPRSVEVKGKDVKGQEHRAEIAWR